MISLVVNDLVTMQDLVDCQISFQKLLNNDIPMAIISFDNVKMSLEHSIYQQIEFQEFLEADINDKKEELIDYLLFMINKYIYLGIKQVDGTILDKLWGNENSSSLAAASCYASIEQFEFIKMIREHCTFKPWKVRIGENCADLKYVYLCYTNALEHFKRLARMTFNDYDDLCNCIKSKLILNISRQKSGY